ncbi:MAG: hypothetical protein ACOC2B_06035 [Sediminispirochaetaceae bacterium]
MFEFPEAVRIPVGEWVNAIMEWILDNLQPLFDFIGHAGLQVLLAVEEVLLFIPWFVMVPVIGLVAWKTLESVRSAVMLAVMLFLVGTFGYWNHAMNTLSVVIVSVFISIYLAYPSVLP